MEVDGQAAFFKAMMAHLNNHTPAGGSEANKATIKTHAKGAVKEDFIAMFGNDNTLTEEFKEKAVTLFEAAVEVQVAAEVLRIEEEQEEATAEGLQQIIDELTEQLDSYLSYATETFMEENEVAIDSQLRSDITEQFVEGLKNLFTENYIDVPDDKLDVLDTLATKVDELEEALDKEISSKTELVNQLTESARRDAFAEAIADLSPVQVEKFKKLAESVEFDGDVEVYTKKLTTVKEGFLAADKKPASGSKLANLEEGIAFEQDETGKRQNIADPTVAAYAQLLSSTVRK
jgi:hypothetical protein